MELYEDQYQILYKATEPYIIVLIIIKEKIQVARSVSLQYPLYIISMKPTQMNAKTLNLLKFATWIKWNLR